ncbi:MAG: tetratricopeptide repeat protein [Ignavibacteria bacterium]|nr:tetratricopeptide repeat protein [Ignavibacteria bacterium]
MAQQDHTPEIRVFISSTFQDLQDEREYLVKKVFPGLRQLCRERGVEFTEIDLRWGVTAEEAEQGKVLKVCLDEIDRCRPFFIGILGNRYGWIPTLDDIAKDAELLQQYPWIVHAVEDHHSLTDIEIMHGVLRKERLDLKAVFYFCDHENSEIFQGEESSESLMRLKDLKQKIRDAKHEIREKITSPEVLGQAVREDFLELINKHFPANKIPGQLEKERFAHEAFGAAHRQGYVRNEVQMNALTRYCEYDITTPIILTGESGCGKSAFLANWASEYRANHPDAFIILHNIGLTATGNDHLDFIWRVCSEIKERYSLNDEIPATAELLESMFPLWLARAQSDRLIIIIDALDKLQGIPEQLRWLPEYIPPNVRLIVSAVESAELEILRSRSWTEWKLKLLSKKEREMLISKYLSAYGKSLSSQQKQQIAHDSKSSNPLFLRTLLEEIRIFGYFEKLDSQIEFYLSATDIADLFQKVLERLEQDFGTQLVRKVAESLWASRRGLSETELLEMTGASRMELSSLLVALEHHILRRAGLMSFFHHYLRQAVEERYIDSIDLQITAHIHVADYFQECVVTARICDELPWQLLQAGATKRLVECLARIPIFLTLHTEHKKYELLQYWLTINDYTLMVDSYRNTIYRYEQEQNNPIILAKAMSEIGEFFRLSGDFDSAEPYLRRALMLRDKHLGTLEQATLDSLNQLGTLLFEKGNYLDAETFLRTALAIAEAMYGSSHPIVAHNLNDMGMLYFAQGNTESAEPLLQRALTVRSVNFGNNHPLTAQSLNNIGQLLCSKGELNSAEIHCRRAVEIQKALYGEEHPDVAVSMGNVAHILRLKANYEQAEQIYRQLLTLWSKTLGEHHPNYSSTLHQLGELLYEKGDYIVAEDVLKQALAIRERTLGNEHSSTAETLQTLAELLARVEKYDEANHCFLRAIAMRQMSLGNNHPDTASSFHSYSEYLVEKGEYQSALNPVQSAFSIRMQLGGMEHPDTVKSYNLLQAIIDTMKSD